MNPLNVAIFHRGDPYRYARIDGQFAYSVPEFTWQQHRLSKETPVHLPDLQHTYDVAWLDEGKYKRYQLFDARHPIPVVYWSLYPTLNKTTFADRAAMAREQADLVLLDHDDVGRWSNAVSVPVRRLAYATDEYRYCDRGMARSVDVGFYNVYAYSAERPGLDDWLDSFCKRKGYNYLSTKGQNVGDEYPSLVSNTKVMIHLNRTPKTRPPRIFDCAASRTALLSNPMPAVSGEHFEPWVHYGTFNNPRSTTYRPFDQYPSYSDKQCEEIIHGMEWLLDEGHWEHVAERAHQYVMACHTWRVRAVQLRGILLDVFPELGDRREG